MATTLPKLTTTNGSIGRAIHRGLLSSLPRGQKRSSPPTITITATTASLPILSHCRQHNSSIAASSSRHQVGNRRNYSPHTSQYLRRYNNHYFNGYNSNTRNLQRPLAGEINLRSTTTISSTRSFSSFMDKLKQRAEETAKSVVQQASKTVQKTAEKATEQAQRAASMTIESTQRVALETRDKAMKQVSKTASEAAARATKATSEVVGVATKQLSKTASEMTKSTTERLSNSTKTISSGVEETTKAATDKISSSTKAITSGVEDTAKAATQKAEKIAKSSMELKESLTMTGTKVVRSLWWWSLAAIFVYGVASTLPMAIVRYTVEQKKKVFDGKMSSSTGSTTTGGEGTAETGDNDNEKAA